MVIVIVVVTPMRVAMELFPSQPTINEAILDDPVLFVYKSMRSSHFQSVSRSLRYSHHKDHAHHRGFCSRNQQHQNKQRRAILCGCDLQERKATEEQGQMTNPSNFVDGDILAVCLYTSDMASAARSVRPSTDPAKPDQDNRGSQSFWKSCPPMGSF